MKINDINQVSGALKRCVLGLAVGAAVVFGVGQSMRAATITYDFADPPAPNLEGWTEVFPDNGPMWQNNSDWGWYTDNGHLGDGYEGAQTQVGQSPAFTLDGSGSLTNYMIGAPSVDSAPPGHSADIGPVATPGGGFMGMALRNFDTDAYVLWKAFPGTPGDFQYKPLVFSQAELAPYEASYFVTSGLLITFGQFVFARLISVDCWARHLVWMDWL